MLEEEKSPATLFEEYFNDELLQLICTQSVIYARWKGNDKFSVSIDELKVFLAIIMLSGYVSLPRRAMFWGKESDVHNELVSNAMS